MAGNDRMSLLRVLQGGADPTFELNALAHSLLEEAGVTQKWRRLLTTLLPPEQCSSEAQLDEVLHAHLPPYADQFRKTVKEALAIASYRCQSTFPVVKLLVCDAALQFTRLTDDLALCWVHEYRHYKKLTPSFEVHCRLLKEFAEDFWTFYRRLLVYQEAPNPEEAVRLREGFDEVFGQSRGYEQLDACLARTRGRKEALLMVLSHPEIPLHNNPAELGARQRVRKRDVSLQARTPEGIAAWDTFQTLTETARKLGVNLYRYFSDRTSGRREMPSLAALIEERAAALPLAGSWAPSL